MKITANSVTNEELTETYREPMLALESQLQSTLGENDYGGGIRALTFMAISVFDNKIENENFVSNFNKIGYFKYPSSGERIKYLSVAFAIAPSESFGKSPLALAMLFLTNLLNTLKSLQFPLPKGFDVEKLIVDVEREMDALKAHGSLIR